MKSLEELAKIRERMSASVNLRQENAPDSTKVLVGMATCGIAAGARPVLAAFAAAVEQNKLHHVMVTQTGCMGICRFEPVVEVLVPGKPKTVYVHMTPEKVARVVEEHIIGGKPVTEYTIEAAE